MGAGATGQSTNSSAHPAWLGPKGTGGQRDIAWQALQQIVMPMAFGGAPDAATEIAANRSRANLSQSLANQGIAGSGLAAKSEVGLEQGLAANAANQRWQALSAILTPVGQRSQSSGAGGGLDLQSGKVKVM